MEKVDVIINAKYQEVIQFSQSRATGLQYYETDSAYFIAAKDSFFNISCSVKKWTGDASDFETNHKALSNKKIGETQPPFASKILDGKKLFKRIHGVSIVANPGNNVIEFVVPYNQAKINCLEIIGGDIGDYCDFEVYDTPTGLIQQSMGVPAGLVNSNLMLNQFGFNVYVRKDFYEQKSEYDADLIKDMKLEVHFFNAGQVAKTVAVNFLLNELK